MGTLIGTIVAAFATAAAGVICIKISKNRQRREAEADVEKEQKRIEEAKAEMRKAVFEKDDAAVNAAVAKFLAGCLLGIFALACTTEKAKTEVKYVAADRRIVSMTNEWGVACKAVPDVVFAEIMEKLVEFDALKKEQKVDKRVGVQ